MNVILGLGSNIGNRIDYLQQAVELLGGVHGESILESMVLSPIYESDALLTENSPENWNMPFLNMAVFGETNRSVEELLATIKIFERTLGREDRGYWAPREIDIDILAYGREIKRTDELKIPHPELINRAFALLPFADVAPEWRYPVEGEHYNKTAKELTLRLDRTGITKTNLLLAYNGQFTF